MPTVDTSTIISGFGQSIADWVLGDDRQFSGDAQASKNPPPVGDLNLSDAYFTFKRTYADTDANAVIQKHITQALSANGQITMGLGGAQSNLLIKVSSGDYEALVVASYPYVWDFRVITVGGVTLTIASGKVALLPLVTQTDKAGTPSPFPNSGVPQFRGFINAIPSSIGTLNTFFNQGDFYFNSQPVMNGAVGWQCVISGQPGTWVAFGLPLAGTSFFPLIPWNFGTAPPVAGTHAQGEILWNTAPTAGMGASPNIGWVCVTGGTPGIWKEFGPIGN